ncbi:potassium voltage-gated channel subfamily KQT member 1-like [Vespa mandarinia]|uniref:potassium voltage-gated channel subfamily KQT member 1-like n=1 Tax=Vespa mandarinia TaxID=7446 RepID=UPI00160E0765|nr:potassium voltage-gated channel subfamily KQT member 1-like [Vespa mandarinia]XP_046815532.1 potassium voltage-gated channel subfamily KQT member 1-like [Vespa crabro]XP_047346102.1 potassium voltage-gated channel subfamily KQT member 1-like [Vespa velutina]
MRDRPHRYREHHGQAMPLEEVQGLLLPPSRTGNRGPLNVTIVQVGRGNGGGTGDSGNDLLRLEPPSDLRPAPSPLSDTSATLQSDINDTFTGGVDPRLLLGGTGIGGDRNTWEGRYHVKEHRRAGKATFQGQVYNFLERPTGWKCFLYHFSV